MRKKRTEDVATHRLDWTADTTPTVSFCPADPGGTHDRCGQTNVGCDGISYELHIVATHVNADDYDLNVYCWSRGRRG